MAFVFIGQCRTCFELCTRSPSFASSWISKSCKSYLTTSRSAYFRFPTLLILPRSWCPFLFTDCGTWCIRSLSSGLALCNDIQEGVLYNISFDPTKSYTDWRVSIHHSETSKSIDARCRSSFKVFCVLRGAAEAQELQVESLGILTSWMSFGDSTTPTVQSFIRPELSQSSSIVPILGHEFKNQGCLFPAKPNSSFTLPSHAFCRPLLRGSINSG